MYVCNANSVCMGFPGFLLPSKYIPISGLIYFKLQLCVNGFVVALVSGAGCIPAVWPRPCYEINRMFLFFFFCSVSSGSLWKVTFSPISYFLISVAGVKCAAGGKKCLFLAVNVCLYWWDKEFTYWHC